MTTSALNAVRFSKDLCLQPLLSALLLSLPLKLLNPNSMKAST